MNCWISIIALFAIEILIVSAVVWQWFGWQNEPLQWVFYCYLAGVAVVHIVYLARKRNKPTNRTPNKYKTL